MRVSETWYLVKMYKNDGRLSAVTYLKTLIGKNSEVQVAMEKLDKLTAQEGRAVATATLSSASEIRAVATATLSAASEILSQLETRMKCLFSCCAIVLDL